MAKEFEERARRYGCRFVVLCGLWFTLGGGDIEAFFTTEPDEDNDYDPKLRFAATDNDTEHELRQAQLREVVDVLLQDLVSFLKSPWVTKAVRPSHLYSCRASCMSSPPTGCAASERYPGLTRHACRL
jgi:hypothetical protein